MKPEESSPYFFRSGEDPVSADVYFLTDQPYFDESARPYLPDGHVVQADSWQTVQVWPLYFHTKDLGDFCITMAFDIHRNCFAYLTAVDTVATAVLDRLFAPETEPMHDDQAEALDCIGTLLDTAAARIENHRLRPGELVIYRED